MTITVEQFKEKHMEDGEVFDAKEVYRGPREIEHKSVLQTSVYQVTSGAVEQYFEVTTCQDNSGYWSDGESYEPEVNEVKPRKIVVEQTVWDAV
jgi:hypothetical protein